MTAEAGMLNSLTIIERGGDKICDSFVFSLSPPRVVFCREQRNKKTTHKNILFLYNNFLFVAISALSLLLIISVLLRLDAVKTACPVGEFLRWARRN